MVNIFVKKEVESFMDVVAKVPEIFNAEGIVIESRAVVYLAFSSVMQDLPSETDELIAVINSIPKRDHFKMVLTSDSENRMELCNKEDIENIDFDPLTNYANNDDGVYVQITIDKTVQNNLFSVYCFEKFSEDLLKLPTITLMKWFSEALTDAQYLIFQLFDDTDFFMTTNTIAFTTGTGIGFKPSLARRERIQACKEIGNFYNMGEYELIPDDFNIKNIESEKSNFRAVFDRLKTIFSIIYTASSASILADDLSIQINGQKNLNCTMQLNKIHKNEYLHKIYEWIYTEGNVVDKVLIARKVMSLHCSHLDIFAFDNKVYSAIKSNYELYLKNNIEQYLAMIKEFSIFISEIITQISSYSVIILGKFKKNIMAIGIFFLIVMIPRLGSSQWNVFFSRDIVYLFQILLFGSVLYLIISWVELKYKVRKIGQGYIALKENYENVLSESEINDILKDDELLTRNLKSVRTSSIIWASIWGFTLLFGIVIIELFTGSRGLFTWLLVRI